MITPADRIVPGLWEAMNIQLKARNRVIEECALIAARHSEPAAREIRRLIVEPEENKCKD